MNNDKRKMKKIQKFKNLCNIDQPELKAKLVNILSSMGYKNIVNENGFVYVKGELPVLLIAHMDTVHMSLPEIIKIEEKDGKTILSSPFGIGGDDRCGVYMILDIIKDMKCSVLFCEDEEIGLVGASLFSKSKYIKNLDVNYIIEFDRKGSRDAVFYYCDNKEFETFVTESGFFKTERGLCSDISRIAPASGIAAVNLSCGYYNAHKKDEYVIFEQMQDVIEEAKLLIMKPVEQPFEYQERAYYASNSGWSGNYYGDWYDGWDDFGGYNTKNSSAKYKRFQTFGICYFDRGMNDYDFVCIEAIDEDDALFDFLLQYKEVPYADVLGVYNEAKLERWGMI